MCKIIANWKMYLTVQESRNLSADLLNWLHNMNLNAEIVVCPSDLAIRDVEHQLSGSSVHLGAQNIAMNKDLGAYTGQVAAQQLKELNCTHAILGHSEQREYWGIGDGFVKKQLQTSLHHNIRPVVCVGENQEQREQKITDQIIERQLHHIFEGVHNLQMGFDIAYEPIWAIGTGKACDSDEAERIHLLIIHVMKEYSEKRNYKVLYGGSVNADNIKTFINKPGVDGVLIGGASADSDSFKRVIEALTI